MSIEEITRYADVTIRILFAFVTVLLIIVTTTAVLKMADASERTAAAIERQQSAEDPFAWDNL